MVQAFRMTLSGKSAYPICLMKRDQGDYQGQTGNQLADIALSSCLRQRLMRWFAGYRGTERAGDMSDFALTPLVATVVFVLSCLCGHSYRRVWKADGPRWQLWVFGLLTASGFLLLGFVPLEV